MVQSFYDSVVCKNDGAPVEAACRSNHDQNYFIFEPTPRYKDPPDPNNAGSGSIRDHVPYFHQCERSKEFLIH